ncbi:binding-protein-dependent transporters inner membrane component [Natrinema pellirubrum DSM 15624]|uniref:ABC-type sugar transport system, permease component n=1 Tax=Natrinema pellirubrum (strain DSM 15624 / CIP 106293 / JCM 10476 / NCIMB 786 / 157) TaxID=797303 RepID=L0JP87_NATP1|nr:carbohydrate ABC transporter permease [Natrinema pellirubrum]AGB33325.1 ABC-type sugar transport system, permease component [Natrinema pellirubrum DSM 15624]ELY71694.1 binding-protein-dependent transporters inner membrane component [Natrinema pellirubrum DSM 15624]
MSQSEPPGGVFGLSYDRETSVIESLKVVSTAIIVLVGAWPIYWMTQLAFTEYETVEDTVTVFPTPDIFTLDNFNVLTEPEMYTYMFNTVVVAIGTIVTVVLVSLIAGYGLARLEFPQKENFARILLIGYLFSPIVIGIPLYQIWQTIGLLGTRFGLIIALSAISMPFAVWLMWKYIMTIPEAHEEAAWVDGASRWRGFRDVVVPQCRPAIIAAALFAFALAWNDFTFAQILLPQTDTTTFAPGILRAMGQAQFLPQAYLMAISLAMTLPPLLFAYFMQSYLLKGFQVRAL